QVRAAPILRAVSFIDTVVESLLPHRFEPDLPCHSNSSNAPRLLSQGRLVPTGRRAVIGSNVERTINRHGPDPRRRPIGDTITTERCDVEIVRGNNFLQLVFGPILHP